MFIRLLLLLLAVFALIQFLRWYSNAPKEQASQILWKGIFGLLFLILLGMVLTGRLNWLFAVVAAIIPFARKLLPLLRFLPFLSSVVKKRRENKQHRDGNQHKDQGRNKSQSMSKSEAWEVLGLAEGASRDEIIARHRKLMLKAHPDKGGSDWLAARLNEAKTVLLKD